MSSTMLLLKTLLLLWMFVRLHQTFGQEDIDFDYASVKLFLEGLNDSPNHLLKFISSNKSKGFIR